MRFLRVIIKPAIFIIHLQGCYSLYIIDSKSSSQPYEIAITSPILQMRKRHQRKVKNNYNVGFNGSKAEVNLRFTKLFLQTSVLEVVSSLNHHISCDAWKFLWQQTSTFSKGREKIFLIRCIISNKQQPKT